MRGYTPQGFLKYITKITNCVEYRNVQLQIAQQNPSEIRSFFTSCTSDSGAVGGGVRGATTAEPKFCLSEVGHIDAVTSRNIVAIQGTTDLTLISCAMKNGNGTVVTYNESLSRWKCWIVGRHFHGQIPSYTTSSILITTTMPSKVLPNPPMFVITPMIGGGRCRCWLATSQSARGAR